MNNPQQSNAQTSGATMTRPTVAEQQVAAPTELLIYAIPCTDRHQATIAQQMLTAFGGELAKRGIRPGNLSTLQYDQLESILVNAEALTVKQSRNWAEEIGCSAADQQATTFASHLVTSLLTGPFKPLTAFVGFAGWAWNRATTTTNHGKSGIATPLAQSSNVQTGKEAAK